MKLPQLFVPAPEQPALPTGGALMHVLDVFELVDGPRRGRVVVGVDADGVLVVERYDALLLWFRSSLR